MTNPNRSRAAGRRNEATAGKRARRAKSGCARTAGLLFRAATLCALLAWAVAPGAAAAPGTFSKPTPVATPLLDRVQAPLPPLLQRPAVPFDPFFGELRSFGTWIQLRDGRWGWQPARVAPDWRPFRRGTWVFTFPQTAAPDQPAVRNVLPSGGNPDWFWIAEEPWGWATSHYGHWESLEEAAGAPAAPAPKPPSRIENPKSPWVWFPDQLEWSPARVAWSAGERGIAWGALPRLPAASAAGAGTNPTIEWGCTFFSWGNVARAAIPRAGTLKGLRPSDALEALVISSATATDATPELLAQTRVLSSVAPDRSLLERKTGRRLAPCRIMESEQPRELLVVARDETLVVAFRPIVKDSPAQVQQFLARRAERYRALEQRKAK